jgi:PTS system N-acetylglucosamine-specific IIC component
MLTGVTEPIEFSFMFLAPVLYVLHAVLTGAAMVIMNLIGVKLGFGFSAGLFDYVLNFGKATRPLLLLPVGLVYFGLYYGLFRLFIRRFDLKTPGREDAAPPPAAIGSAGPLARPRAFVEALGGPANLVTVGACTTRLRLVVNNQDGVDEARLRALGVLGLVRPSARDLQVVVGATADQLAREIGEVLAAAPVVAVSAPAIDAQALAAALGGPNNVTKVETRATRLVVTLANGRLVDEAAAMAAGARAIAGVAADHMHVVIGPDAERAGADLTALVLG